VLERRHAGRRREGFGPRDVVAGGQAIGQFEREGVERAKAPGVGDP
jgi:hypothetical protein